MAHTHEPQKSIERAFKGPARGAHLTKDGEFRAAHGGKSYLQTCSCGAIRETNENGRHVELGAWYRPTAEEI